MNSSLDADDELVPTHLHSSDANQEVILTPKEPLEPEATYTAVLRAGLSDEYGNLLTSDVVWHFTTRAEDPSSKAPERTHFFDSLVEEFPGGLREGPATDAPGKVIVDAPDADVRQEGLRILSELGAPPPVGEGVIEIGRKVRIRFPVSCSGAHDGLEAAGVSASDAPLLHATGTTPEDDDPFELTVRRHETDGELVHHVTFEILDSETAVSEARHVRSGGTWRDMDGADAGPLIYVTDSRITAHGELRFGDLPMGLMMVLDAQCR